MNLRVTYEGGKAFSADVRGHRVLSDQRLEHGGQDLGPTPLEFMMTSLAACTALYASTYLRRRNIPHRNLTVDAEWEKASAPSRVTSIRLIISGVGELSEEDKAGLLEAAGRCTVKKTIETRPEMEIVLA